MPITHLDRPVRVGLRVVIAALAAACTLAACTTSSSDSHSSINAQSLILDPASVMDIIGAYQRAGLPATAPHDVTATTCETGQDHCRGAAATDETLVIKFDATSDATAYSQQHPGTFQIEDIAVVFAPSVSPPDRARYASITTLAVE
ncbi:hypothetical protein HH308_08820 [Gordonia sp. TBRC 11910]|uniref:Lipoprotein n=1 Tax=Gordonia asplenii TaxID=2725283 RepID=A0A848KTJ8_9ACTN|nr:hypothetical protein [Gordonia asplenii]NMO01317.1 hypothetical protein [Gordonia asplenii]